MNQTVADHVTAVTPYLSSSIANSESLSQVQALAHTLPPASFGIFESRLGEELPVVDFSVCLRPSDREQNTITKHDFAYNNHEAWVKTRHFCRQWAKSSSILYKNVENIWLEFDVTDTSNHLLPSLFFGLHPASRKDLATCFSGLSALLDGAVSKTIQDHIQVCLATLTSLLGEPLPSHAGIFQVGVMLARNDENIKICVAGIPTLQIPTYLTAIGWKGSLSEIQSTLERFVPYIDEVVLHLEVGKDFSPKIGLETFVYTNTASMKKERWLALLSQLVEHNMCTLGKREAVLNWMGISRVRSGDNSLDSHSVNAMIRKINHLKFVLEPNSEPIAKAYLSFEYLQLTPEFNQRVRTKINTHVLANYNSV